MQTFIYIQLFIAPKFAEVHVGLQNCSYNQFTTLSLYVFMQVTARHIDVSAAKNSYNEKNTAAARWGVTAGDALSVCVYIIYTACGDQVKCSSLFHEQKGQGELDSYRTIYQSDGK